MKWQRAMEGQLLIDHSQSPGLPEDAPGHRVPAGQKYECATYTCPHCSTVVLINPLRNRDRTYCFHCGRHVCDQAVCTMMAAGTVPHRSMSQLMDDVVNSLTKGIF